MSYGLFLAILISGPALSLILWAVSGRLPLTRKAILAPLLAMTIFFAFCYVDFVFQWRVFDRVSFFVP